MDLSDEALVAKFIATQDVNYFRSLVRRYQDKVYNLAVRILGNTEEAEEVVQDTFVKVHQNLDKFRSHNSFGSWVFRITHNQCVDLVRNRRRRRAGFQLLPYDPQAVVCEGDESDAHVVTQVADPKPGPEQQIDFGEQEKIIAQSLDSLPEDQRVVLILRDVEGLSYQEIANVVGASIGTVRSRIHYGRLKLKDLLEPYFGSQSMSPASR